MEFYIKCNVSARHKTLAGPPIFLAEHNLYARTYPPFLHSARMQGGLIRTITYSHYRVRKLCAH